jgi:4,5-DOPA dioxygenase extradiol
MAAMRLPTVFVSHGAPTLAVEDNSTTRFLRALGQTLPRPRAILIATAHWDTAQPMVGGAARPDTIHDFGGFPDALYRLRYEAPGAPDVAAQAKDLLRAAGFQACIDGTHGLDHGAWVPLLHAYPGRDVPVAPLSIQSHLGPEHHFRVGRALAPLADDGVLIVGSGSITHNLREVFARRGGGDEPAWMRGFVDWMGARLEAGAEAALLDYRTQAPDAARNHPTDEHLLPLYVAMGAAGEGAQAKRIHADTTWGALAMDAYLFGQDLDALAARLHEAERAAA